MFQGIPSVWGSAGPSAGSARLPLAKDGLCHLFLLLEVFPSRSEEARKWAVGQKRRGNSGRKLESFQRITQARTIMPDPQQPTQQACCRWSGSEHVSPACEVFAHIQMFYLGRVDEVRE